MQDSGVHSLLRLHTHVHGVHVQEIVWAAVNADNSDSVSILCIGSYWPKHILVADFFLWRLLKTPQCQLQSCHVPWCAEGAHS